MSRVPPQTGKEGVVEELICAPSLELGSRVVCGRGERGASSHRTWKPSFLKCS